MKKQTVGVTLLELLVTVALVAILAAFALPTYRTTVQNNQLVSCANKLVSALQVARSEAVSQRSTILVAADGNLTSIRVGSDPDGNNQVDDAHLMQELDCEGDGLVTTEQNSNATFLAFGANGFRIDGQGQLSFLTCNELGKGRLVRVANSGSITSSEAPDGSC